ncbi:SRPBCC domain-containing protein [Chitinilyticum piscinae]|uniref:SRPBCC domain-containing protein n=1 Tax=Chitinilyticum piscinae TaxID=2866724 RepID=A0A8J7FHF8_9NEIS|nr:SRPBCC domain-containing protein [Chitinilyticum piscinae]MBE9609280.1 SRPBCC domain-containing protein [Chitinilyticum piscinae]
MPHPLVSADPALDLLFSRDVPLTPDEIWAGWTQAEHLLHWFTPAPWQTVECVIEPRAGGRFFSVMRSPEGETFPAEGCVLAADPGRQLVWTNTLQAGYRPAQLGNGLDCNTFPFTVTLALQACATGTHYRALVQHRDAAGREQHAAMGFQEGWGKALDQLVAYMLARREG